jgi:hypothetical protein
VISVSITGGLSVRPPWLSGRRQAMQKRCADHNGLIDNRAGGRRSCRWGRLPGRSGLLTAMA